MKKYIALLLILLTSIVFSVNANAQHATTVWKDGIQSIICDADSINLMKTKLDGLQIWRGGELILIENPDSFRIGKQIAFEDVEDIVIDSVPVVDETANNEDVLPIITYTQEEYDKYSDLAQEVINMAFSDSKVRTMYHANSNAMTEDELEALADDAIKSRKIKNVFGNHYKIEQILWDAGDWGATHYGGFECFVNTYIENGRRMLLIVFYKKGGFAVPYTAYVKLGQANSGKVINGKGVRFEVGKEYVFVPVDVDEYVKDYGMANFFPLLINQWEEDGVKQGSGYRRYLNPVMVKTEPLNADGWDKFKYNSIIGYIDGVPVKYNCTAHSNMCSGKYCWDHGLNLNQCVALCSNYIIQRYNITNPNNGKYGKAGKWGDAGWWPAYRSEDDRFMVFDNGAITDFQYFKDGYKARYQIREGDVIVFQNSSYGHVAVVIKVTPKYISIAHQNAGIKLRPIGTSVEVGSDGAPINVNYATKRSLIGTATITNYIRPFSKYEYYSSDKDPEIGVLHCSAEQLAFGEVSVGQKKTLYLKVTNNTTCDINIESLSLEKGKSFAIDNPDSNSNLAPGKSKLISVTFIPLEGMDYADKLTINTNTSNIIIPLSGRGIEVKHYLTVSEYSYMVNSDGGQVTLEYVSDVPCSFKAKEDWITFSNTENGVMIVAANTSSDKRTNKIIIQNEEFGLKEVVTVVQEGRSAKFYASVTNNSKTYSIYRSVDKTRQRKNSDGTIFYSTQFSIDINGQMYNIPDEMFITTENDDDSSERMWAGACAAVDVNNDKLYFFCFSKDASVNYSMTGYVYEISTSGVQRYNTFTSKNWGWNAYFTTEADVLTLNAFSFAGYYALSAKQSDNWAMKQGAYIKPDAFAEQRKQHETILLFGKEDEPAEGTHEYVDLGLSVKWATCNVGANSPEEYGDYFAWGETSPKSNYSLDNYFDSNYDKYNINGGKTVLDLDDDAAHVNWGGSWRIPTYDELSELRNNCTWIWTAQNGVMGCEVVSNKNGNSIFLPAVGSRWDSSLLGAGSSGNYWTSSIKQDDSSNANCLYFGSSDWYWYGNYRYGGRAIRPVCP